jgi:GxxExxY protein
VILGAFYAVHTEFRFRFLEAIYVNSLAVLLEQSRLQVEREVPYDVYFRKHLVGRYKADLVVESKVIVEVKAARTLIQQHTVQVLNYLKASGLQLGLLLNFGEKADFRRIVRTRSAPPHSASSASEF